MKEWITFTAGRQTVIRISGSFTHRSFNLQQNVHTRYGFLSAAEEAHKKAMHNVAKTLKKNRLDVKIILAPVGMSLGEIEKP